MAAITTICASQSLSAAALTTHYNTMFTQTLCESTSWMTTNVNYWKNTARFKANKIWTADDNVMCGYVAKGGFVRGTWSGIYMGTMMTGDAALVRRLANDYFNNCNVNGQNNFWEQNGCPAYLELKPNVRYHRAQLGDQIHIVNGNQQKWAFVTGLPSAATNYKLRVIELVNNKVTYNVDYDYQTAYLTKGSQQWTMDYYVRPIKQGDVNGDGVVCPEDYDPCASGSDLTAITTYAQQLPSNSVYEVKLLKAAASLDGDDDIDGADYRILQNNLVAQRAGSEYNNGRMQGNWYYVQRPAENS